MPVTLITIGAAGLIQLFTNYFYKGAFRARENLMVAKSAAVERAEATVSEAATLAADQTVPITAEKVYLIPQDIALWFLVGALFALAIYFVWGWFRKDLS